MPQGARTGAKTLLVYFAVFAVFRLWTRNSVFARVATPSRPLTERLSTPSSTRIRTTRALLERERHLVLPIRLRGWAHTHRYICERRFRGEATASLWGNCSMGLAGVSALNRWWVGC